MILFITKAQIIITFSYYDNLLPLVIFYNKKIEQLESPS